MNFFASEEKLYLEQENFIVSPNKFAFRCNMMADSTPQQRQKKQSSTMKSLSTSNNTQQQRQVHVQNLTNRLSLDNFKRNEDLSLKQAQSNCIRLIDHQDQELQNGRRNREIQQQQRMAQSVNNSSETNSYSQKTDSPLFASTSQIPASLSAMLSQPIRLSSNQSQTRLVENGKTNSNGQPNLSNNQPMLGNGAIRFQEPHPFQKASSLNSTASPSNTSSVMISIASSAQTIDPSKTQPVPSQISKTTSLHGSPQANRIQSALLSQLSMHTRAQTNLNASSKTDISNSMHQFLLGIPGITMANNISSNAKSSSPMFETMVNTTGTVGDQFLQKIPSAHNDGNTVKSSTTHNRPAPSAQYGSGSIKSQIMKSSMGTTNGRTPSTTTSTSMTNRTTSLSSMPMSSSTSNLLQTTNPSSSISLSTMRPVVNQQSLLNMTNNNHASLPPTSIQTTITQSSIVTTTNSMSTTDRAAIKTGTGVIVNPNEETVSIIKYFKANIVRLQQLGQKYLNEGSISKARDMQNFQQIMLQFITNPTEELLPQAKKLRQGLERGLNRSQTSNGGSSTTSARTITSSKNDFIQYEKAFQSFFSHDQQKRATLTKLFIEPLNDVLNGVPHKKIRLDVDNDSQLIAYRDRSSAHQSFIARLNDELIRLPSQTFSIDKTIIGHGDKDSISISDYSSSTAVILSCLLLGNSHPLLPPLRIRVGSNYPDEPPEILSITKTTPPRLDSADTHPLFEEISKYFLYHLFQSSTYYTITDILNIWKQSVQTVIPNRLEEISKLGY